MKRKSSKNVLNHIAKSRYENRIKRKSKNYNSDKYQKFKKYLLREEKKLINKKIPPSFDFLEKQKCFKNLKPKNIIYFPKNFSLSDNYDESIESIFSALYSYNSNYNKTITLSFKKCEKVQIICLFLLENLLLNIFNYRNKLQPKLHTNITNKIEIEKSKNKNVNKRLCVFDDRLLFELDLEDNELIPIKKDIYNGQKNSKSYVESKKKRATKKIVSFLNKQIVKCSNYELSEIGVNNLEGIISETIDNAEQHSFFRGEWFVCAYFFEDKEVEIGKKVIETQLHFLNLGSTIHESFTNRKTDNKEMYDFLNKTTNDILNKTHGFSTENILTLLALNEGVSSLRYEDEGRGTGTIKLLKAFFEIGDHEDKSRGLYPKMVILSGQTLINIDNEYKYTTTENGKIVIPLNKEKDVYAPPSKSHLKNLNSYFPGTLLSLRLYLNENNLKNKF